MEIVSDKPKVLISGVNLTEGGPLNILKDAVNAFIAGYIKKYHLVLLINNKSYFLHLSGNPDVTIVEYAYPKRSWLLKLWFEYIHSWFISKRIRPFLWFSMHDVTPNVITKNKVVYCHNPAPFYKIRVREMLNEITLAFFHFFYSLIYRINIKKNRFVIVQQQWLRVEFIKRYKVRQVVVAYPAIDMPPNAGVNISDDKIFRFCYPALPRSFKNFEVIIEAVSFLKNSWENFEVLFTLDGTENGYAAKLVKKYRHISYIKFLGRQSREKMWEIYGGCHCIIFPSKMETWGLPISEAKLFDKPILVANCKYAYETVGNYNKACFFEADDHMALATLMQQAINGSLQYEVLDYKEPPQPFVRSWKELYDLILSNKLPQNADTEFQLANVTNE